MFDIGFSELFLIAVVALLVLGPERLPKAARFAGLWVRRARAQWYSVRSELERELATEELQRSLRDTRQAVTDIGDDMRAAEAEARREFDAMQSQIASDAADDSSSDIDHSTALLDSDDQALLAAIDGVDMRQGIPSDDIAPDRIASNDSASDGSLDVRR